MQKLELFEKFKVQEACVKTWVSNWSELRWRFLILVISKLFSDVDVNTFNITAAVFVIRQENG